MGINVPKGGIGYAAEFQSSALPFVTSSTAPQASGGCMRLDFPKITRSITVANNESAGTYLRLGFTRNGVMGAGGGAYYYRLNGGQQVTFELRVTNFYVAGDTGTANFSLCAGLTNIDAIEMPQLTGSLGNGIGWLGVG